MATSSGREIWFWYARQMAALLPGSWRSAAGRPANAVVVDASRPADMLTVWRRERGIETRLETVQAASVAPLLARQPAGMPIVLRLPPNMLLTSDVVLPLAAEMDLAGALALNFDTLTPFSPDEAFWSFETISRNVPNSLLHVRLALLPKAAIATFAGAAIAGSAEFVHPGGETRVLRLGGRDGAGVRRRRVLAPALAGLAAGVLLAAIGQPVVAVMLRSRSVEAQIAALHPKLAQTEALRRKVESSLAGQDMIAEERARVGDPLAMLAMLTDALPDDASLTELAITQRRVALTGEASGAARLVLSLSDAPFLTGVAFAAPVIHAASGGKDVFTIQAQIKR